MVGETRSACHLFKNNWQLCNGQSKVHCMYSGSKDLVLIEMFEWKQQGD